MSGPVVLGVVPARGGSKTIPGKNVKPFAGKPLLAWTVEAARASGIFDRLVLSTDDPQIRRAGLAAGIEVPFDRPSALATDMAGTADVVRHVLDQLRASRGYSPDFVFVLEPTAPARRPFHIVEALALQVRSGAETVAGVSRVPHHYVPTKVLRMTADGDLAGIDGTRLDRMIHRRQDLPAFYALNGAVYACMAMVFRREPPTIWGARVVGYEMDAKYALDLDEPSDWAPAEDAMRRILAEEDA